MSPGGSQSLKPKTGKPGGISKAMATVDDELMRWWFWAWLQGHIEAQRNR
jgi:hypothetical protein